MSQPVKLSDALVLDARIAAEAQERSIAGQVEFWARLGKSIDLLLEGRQLLKLQQVAGARPLSEALVEVDTPAGRERVRQVLARQPFPHFEQHPTKKQLLVKIDEDGTRTLGRFVNRVFVAEPSGRVDPGERTSSGETRKDGRKLAMRAPRPGKQPVRA